MTACCSGACRQPADRCPATRLPLPPPAVLLAALLVTFVERTSSPRGAVPAWRPLGLPPAVQALLGRAAMAAFAGLLAWEAVHSSSPALPLFYLF